MLIAATLGALLLTAAASSAGTFSEAVAKIQTESVDAYENVLARIDRDVRYAWWVDVPAHDRLQVLGPDNLVTVYHVVGNSLLVTRPDGSSGSILTGLDSLRFDNDVMQRLRSDRTTQFSTTMASVPAPASTPTGGGMASTMTLALSFIEHRAAIHHRGCDHQHYNDVAADSTRAEADLVTRLKRGRRDQIFRNSLR